MTEQTENRAAKSTSKLTNRDLYDRQVALLNLFLQNRTITQAQYDKSFHDLTEKMGMETGSSASSDLAGRGT